MLKEVCNDYSNVMEITQDDFLKKREFKKLDIPKSEKELIDNWFRYNGNYYYLKYVDGLNEFIGQNLADKLNLPTARYRLVKYRGNIQVASLYFKNSEYTYFKASELSEEMNLSELLSDDYPELKENLLKLMAIDIFMRQSDRVDKNLLFKKDKTGKLYLGEVFDYSDSFCCTRYSVYNNPIKKLELINSDFSKTIPDKISKIDYYNMLKNENVKNFQFLKFMTMYPQFAYYLEKLRNLDAEKLLVQIERQLSIDLLKVYREYYLKEIENSKILLRSIF